MEEETLMNLLRLLFYDFNMSYFITPSSHMTTFSSLVLDSLSPLWYIGGLPCFSPRLRQLLNELPTINDVFFVEIEADEDFDEPCINFLLFFFEEQID